MVERDSRTRRSALRTSAEALAFALTATTLAGCAVGPSDLERWERTSEGPKRLSAVVLFDKYPHPLRVDAAMALIDMKPVKGQRVGIERLVKGALVCDASWLDRKVDEPCLKTSLSPEKRAKLLESLVPRLIEELKKPPPQPAQAGQLPVDPSYKFKDAAFLLLTYDKTPLLTDAALKQQLLDALREWAMVDFARKLADQTQMFGMEQLLRLIGPTSVEKLHTVMDRNRVAELTRIADLVDKLGDAKSKEETGKKLVEIYRYIASDQWRKDKDPEVKAANEARQLTPTDKQFAQQMSDFQEDTLTKIFAAMRKVGGPTVIDHCLAVASDKTRSEKLRSAALQPLDGRMDKKDAKTIARLLEIPRVKETPPVVIDLVFRLVKQLPRDAVVKPLYGLLDLEDWKVRRLVGATLLQVSKAEHIPEFMAEIAKGSHKNFNPNEAQTYAKYIGDLQDGSPVEKIQPFLKTGDIYQRTVALSFYLVHGSKADVPTVKAFAEDKDKVSKCDEKDKNDCVWECIVVGADKKEEKKTIETVGDFVTHCVLPPLGRKEKEEKPKDKPAETGKNEKAKDEKPEGE